VRVPIKPSFDFSAYLEDVRRIQHRLRADHWRDEVRPRALRAFADRAAKLTWSDDLLVALLEELFLDPVFHEIVGDLHSIPRRRWPCVMAVALACRHSWRRDGLTRLSEHLQLPTAPPSPRRRSDVERGARRRAVKARRTAPPPHGGADGLDRPAASHTAGTYLSADPNSLTSPKGVCPHA